MKDMDNKAPKFINTIQEFFFCSFFFGPVGVLML